MSNFVLPLLLRQSKLFKQGRYWISEPMNVLRFEAVLTNFIKMKQEVNKQTGLEDKDATTPYLRIKS